MWFLKGRPTSITVRALIESIVGGYQNTTIRFNINAESEEKIWIAIAIPWAPHKKNGGINIMQHDLLNKLEGSDDVIQLTAEDVQVWERLRSIKREPNIELVHVQELCNWYLDDIGVVTCWVEPSKTYQLSYSHKIASTSRLFFPTRLPTIISVSHKPKMDYQLWVVNGITIELPEWVIKEKINCGENGVLDLLKFKDWAWNEDIQIITDNWESSDDDWSSEKEDN